MSSSLGDMFGFATVAAEAFPKTVVLELARELAAVVIVFSLTLAIWKSSLPLRHVIWPPKAAGEKPKRAARLDSCQPAAVRRAPVTLGSAAIYKAPSAARAEPRAPTLSAEASAKAGEEKVLLHLEKHQFTVALNAFRTYERDGLDRFFTEELFSRLIQSSIRVSKLDVTLDMLRKIKRSGRKPSIGFWHTTFRLLASRKLCEGCLAVYAIFGNDLPVDRVVFTCLVNAAIVKERFDIASDLLEQHSGLIDLEPNDYVIFFRTYVGRGEAQRAEELFLRLGQRGSGEFVTSHMLNLTLLTIVNSKQAARAMDVLRKAHELEQVYSKKIADVVSYNTVLKGCAAGVDNARSVCCDCLRSMAQQSIDFDDITCRLVDSCIDGNNSELAGDVCDVFLSQPTMGVKNTTMSTCLIKCLFRSNRMSKVLEVYGEMRRGERSVSPDMSTYAVLVKGFVDHRDIERTLEIVADMRADGHCLEDVMLMHVLDGCRFKARVNAGMEIFKESVASGVKVSVFTLASLLKLLGRVLKVREALEILDGWEAEHGWRPSVVHYTCVISACMRTGQTGHDEVAWKAYELMLSNRIAPDEMALKTLARCLQEARRWDRILELSHQASQLPTPVKIPAEILNSALAHMSSCR